MKPKPLLSFLCISCEWADDGEGSLLHFQAGFLASKQASLRVSQAGGSIKDLLGRQDSGSAGLPDVLFDGDGRQGTALEVGKHVVSEMKRKATSVLWDPSGRKPQPSCGWLESKAWRCDVEGGDEGRENTRYYSVLCRRTSR